MIIKEFRILIPMSVDEYQIGQLYTIQKKSRIESTGAGSGVEILENKPYESNDEKGQYTLKVYHVDERLPAALKTVSKLLFPKSALLFEEESWNCYPHTRTKYSHKLFKSFNIDIESKYISDYGQNENVFNLNRNELSIRSVEYIDIVNDPINQNEYKIEEDPAKFHSTKTNRGPLAANWSKELKVNANENHSYLNNLKINYMCAYKLCRIECAFWGCQSRVEKLISESVLRHTILMSHRQAWCWQDEYVDLSMDDVRQLEAETQRYLTMKMKNSEFTQSISSLRGDKNSKMNNEDNNNKNNKRVRVNDDNQNEINQKSSDKLNNDTESLSKKSNNKENISQEDKQSNKSSKLSLLKSKSLSNESDYEDFPYNDFFVEATSQNNLSIKIPKDPSQGSNFDEFFDAISQASICLSTNDSETYSINSLSYNANSFSSPNSPTSKTALTNSNNNVSNTKSTSHADRFKQQTSCSSAPLMNKNSVDFTNQNSLDIAESLINKKQKSFDLTNSSKGNDNETTKNSTYENKKNNHDIIINKLLENSHSMKNKQSSESSRIDTLILVVHGGNVTCTDTSKMSDFSNFKSTMESIIKSNYSNLYGRIAYRLVKCEPICKEALIKLSGLSPVANEKAFSMNESDDFAETSAAIFSLHENLPFNTLPLLALANQNQYRSNLLKFIKDCNKIYQEFLNSSEGKFFQGQIVMIGDSLGSLLAYDSLCQGTNNQNSEESPIHRSSSISSIHQTQQSTNLESPEKTNKENTNPLISISDLSSCNNDSDKKKENDSDENDYNNNNINNNNSNVNLLKRISSNGSNYSSGIEFTVNNPLLINTPSTCLLSPQSPNSSIKSNNNNNVLDEKLDFDISHFFVFGSPLGLILAFRKLAKMNIDMPCCSQMYNLFHLTDPVAIRIEPLLCKQFTTIEPCMIPRYSKFPLGDGSNISLDHFIVKYGHLFEHTLQSSTREAQNPIPNQEMSNLCLTPNFDQLKQLQKMMQTKKQWWGENRIDYVLYAPETIVNLPRKSLPYLFHSCFWESADVVAFILRMINKSENFNLMAPETNILKNDIGEPVEKWQRRLNRVKLRNLSANHRANDVIVLEDREQVLTAKFSYGPLDFALSGEKIDIYIINKTSNDGECQYFATESTDNHGRIKYKLPKDKRQPLGIYQIRMVVKCDRSFVEFFMAVLPSNTECIVFSIDGSFAANISFSGNDPKVRAGAVDVVRHWHELGYLILYVTARPDIQHYKVTNWLAQHNFPLGMVFFSDGISTDPIKQKTETLRNLTVNSDLKLQAAYGSAKDIPMYSSLGVPANKIFIIGKMKNKFQNQAIELKDGYASHLSMLQNPNTGSRQASGNARLFLKKDSFNIRTNTMFSNNTINNNNEKNNENVDYLKSHSGHHHHHHQTFSFSVDPPSESSISSFKDNSNNSKNLLSLNETSSNFLKQRLNKLQSSSELILNRTKKPK